MDIQEVKIGTRLELELINRLGEKVGQTYISQLIDTTGKEDIIILCPIFESKFVFIAAGSNIRILFMHDKFGLMSFTAVIANKEKKGNILLLHVKINSELEMIQRRRYYRLDCNLKAIYRVFPGQCDEQEKPVEPDLEEFKKAITKNLSGNGSSIVIEENIPKGSILEVLIYLSENSRIRALCLVMRTSEVYTSKQKKYELGLYFKQISAKDQEIMVKYIFDQQRLLLKKNTEKPV